MLRIFWLNVSTIVVQLRECMVRHGAGRRRIQSSEEVVADLYTYLEQLNIKCGELESKVQKCNQRALFHRQRAANEGTRNCKQREINRAKLYLQDKHRLQEDQDRTLRFMHLIRQQIDTLTSSQMDNIMVDAMKQYNMTTKRMGLPDKTKEIESLSSEIQSRFTEVHELQQIMSEATDPFNTGILKEEDEDELMMELNALGEITIDIDEEIETEVEATTNENNKNKSQNFEQQLRQRIVPNTEPKNNGDNDESTITTLTQQTLVISQEEPLLS